MVAGGTESMIWVSSDYGESWTMQFESGWGAGSSMTDAGVSADGRVMVMTESFGLMWMSHDYGESWRAMPAGYRR